MGKELARELINAGVHFGHGANRWNPKMEPYIFGKRGNIHIIDVKTTLKGILLAKKQIAEVVSSGSDVVFVGTKRQAQKAVEQAAAQCQMHYVSERWLGGMLTNFRTIRSRLQRLEQLEAMEKDGSLVKESKKQAARYKREMRKIRTNLDGVRKMARLPGLVVVVDAKKEYLALRETPWPSAEPSRAANPRGRAPVLPEVKDVAVVPAVRFSPERTSPQPKLLLLLPPRKPHRWKPLPKRLPLWRRIRHQPLRPVRSTRKQRRSNLLPDSLRVFRYDCLNRLNKPVKQEFLIWQRFQLHR